MIPTQEVKNTINKLLDAGMKDKQEIYTKVVEELGVPRPTVRRVTRDLIKEMMQKITILQSEVSEPTLEDRYLAEKQKQILREKLGQLETGGRPLNSQQNSKPFDSSRPITYINPNTPKNPDSYGSLY